MWADKEEEEFLDYLLRVGEGKEEIIDDFYLVETRDNLIEKVFPNLWKLKNKQI